MSNVTILPVWTTQPIPMERVLEGNRDLETVLVLGWNKEGAFVAACSGADLYTACYAAQKFIHKCQSGDYDVRGSRESY